MCSSTCVCVYIFIYVSFCMYFYLFLSHCRFISFFLFNVFLCCYLALVVYRIMLHTVLGFFGLFSVCVSGGGSLMLIKLLTVANGQQNVLSGRSSYANRELQAGSKLNVCIYFFNNSAL